MGLLFVLWVEDLSPYEMRHVFRDDHGDFYETGHRAILEPGGLIDHFLYAFFEDGVGIGSSIFQQGLDGFPGMFRVAVLEIFANEVPVGCKGTPSLVVHENNVCLFVANGDGTVHFLCPSVSFVHGTCFFRKNSIILVSNLIYLQR